MIHWFQLDSTCRLRKCEIWTLLLFTQILNSISITWLQAWQYTFILKHFSWEKTLEPPRASRQEMLPSSLLPLTTGQMTFAEKILSFWEGEANEQKLDIDFESLSYRCSCVLWESGTMRGKKPGIWNFLKDIDAHGAKWDSSFEVEDRLLGCRGLPRLGR